MEEQGQNRNEKKARKRSLGFGGAWEMNCVDRTVRDKSEKEKKKKALKKMKVALKPPSVWWTVH